MIAFKEETTNWLLTILNDIYDDTVLFLGVGFVLCTKCMELNNFDAILEGTINGKLFEANIIIILSLAWQLQQEFAIWLNCLIF